MGSLFGARYFGRRYFGARYFGTKVAVLTGILAATETKDAAAFAGAIRGTGTLAASEAPDVAAIVAGIRATGTVAVTEAKDGGAFTGFTSTPVDTSFRFPTAHQVISGTWQNPENIYAKDGALCFADHTTPNSNWFLKTEGYGFGPAAIPADAVILKVELESRWQKA